MNEHKLYCKNCGKDLKRTEPFCRYCGEPNEASKYEQPKNNYNNQNNYHNNYQNTNDQNSQYWINELNSAKNLGILALIISAISLVFFQPLAFASLPISLVGLRKNNKCVANGYYDSTAKTTNIVALILSGISLFITLILIALLILFIVGVFGIS